MRFHPNQTKKASVGNEDVQVLHWAAVGRQCKNISSTDRFHFYLVIRMSGVSFQITQHSNSFLFFRQWLLHLVLSCYVSLNSGLPGLTHWICLGQFCWQWQWYLLVIPSSVTWLGVWRLSFMLPLLICQRPRRTARSMWTLIGTSLTSSSHSFILHTSRRWPMSFHFS